MNRRSSLVVAWGLGMLSSTLGCASTQPGAPGLGSNEIMTAEVRKEADLPKRPPKASTCVAFGDFCEKTAAEPQRTPTEQDQYRDKARRAYQQSLQLEPKNLSALTSLARHYNTMGDQDRAVAAYQKAIKYYPKDASLRFELGMCYARFKQWAPAVGHLREAARMDPENRPYLHSLGFCLARAQHFQESYETFAKLEGNASAHYNLARMLHHMQQDVMSKQQLRLALRENPDHAEAKEMLAALETPAPDPNRTIIPAESPPDFSYNSH